MRGECLLTGHFNVHSLLNSDTTGRAVLTITPTEVALNFGGNKGSNWRPWHPVILFYPTTTSCTNQLTPFIESGYHRNCSADDDTHSRFCSFQSQLQQSVSVLGARIEAAQLTNGSGHHRQVKQTLHKPITSRQLFT